MKKRRNGLPIGVSWIERDKIYRSYCSVYDKNTNKHRNIYLGSFKNPEEAFQAYKIFKENYIKQVADEYYSQGLIPLKLYQAMYNYEVEITD